MDDFKKLYLKKVDETITINRKGTEVYLYGIKLPIQINSKYKAVSVKGISFPLYYLVMLAFNPIDNQEDYLIHHKDNDNKNDSLENLEYINRKDFILKYKPHGIIPEGHKKQIIKMFNDGALIAEVLNKYPYKRGAIHNIKSRHCNKEVRTRFIENKETLRQIKILRKDFTYEEIANKLKISISTVSRIVRKYGLVNTDDKIIQEALQLIKKHSVKEVSIMLDINEKTLYSWKRKYK